MHPLEEPSLVYRWENRVKHGVIITMLVMGRRMMMRRMVGMRMMGTPHWGGPCPKRVVWWKRTKLPVRSEQGRRQDHLKLSSLSSS